jgi:hypothetical protein
MPKEHMVTATFRYLHPGFRQLLKVLPPPIRRAILFIDVQDVDAINGTSGYADPRPIPWDPAPRQSALSPFRFCGRLSTAHRNTFIPSRPIMLI